MQSDGKKDKKRREEGILNVLFLNDSSRFVVPDGGGMEASFACR